MLGEVDEVEIRAATDTAESEIEPLDDSSSQNTGMTTDDLWLGDGSSDTDVDTADSDPISPSSVADLLSLPLVQAEQLESMLAALAQQISCYDETTIASIPCNNSNTSQHHLLFRLKHYSTGDYSVFNHQPLQPGSPPAIEDGAKYVARPLLQSSVFSRSLTVITSAGGLLGGSEHAR